MKQISLSSLLCLLMLLSAGNIMAREPIIDFSMPGTGDNINGPSMIRIPDWIPPQERADPSAVYYLYFAHHTGGHIRMAWASDINGPYTVYNPDHGVLEITALNPALTRMKMVSHIASPDVHVDDANHRIIMYFHGDMSWDGKRIPNQTTGVAVSGDGLDFNGGVQDMVLCWFYARVFEYGGEMYAFCNQSQLWKARDAEHPWTNPPPNGGPAIDIGANGGLWERIHSPLEDIPKTCRHVALRRRGNLLDIFYTRYPMSPEHIEMSTLDLSAGEGNWVLTDPVSVLKPEFDWEGADLPLSPSGNGSATGVRQLRDPCIFTDIDGTEYLLYSGRGEEAIGIVRLADVF